MQKLLSILLAAVLFLSVTITNPNKYPDYTSPQTGIEQHSDITAGNKTEDNEQVSPCDDSGTPPPLGDTPS